MDRDLTWKLAQILEVRYEVPYDEDALFWDPEESTAEITTTTATKAVENGVTDQAKDPKTPIASNGVAEETKQG